MDERFMARALELARVPPFTSPNPRVGAVLVRDGEVVAEAFHSGAGTLHAEALALAGVDAVGADLFVTLEPCNHEAQTPPCAPAVAAAGVGRVIAAMEDPDARVAGRGFAYLRSHGIEVVVGVLAAEARALNRPYIHQRSTGRSFLTLKVALTLDGRWAAPDGTSRWITGPEARREVHARRVEADAVVLGVGTVVADDPAVTVREVAAPRHPARVVLDSTGRTPATARLFGSDGGPVIMATTDACPHEVATAWKEAGAEVLVLPRDPAGIDVRALLGDLGRRGFVEVYCEAGPTLSTSLLAAGLVDRLEVHYGPKLIGVSPFALGDLGVATIEDAIAWRTVSVGRAGDDVIVILERED